MIYFLRSYSFSGVLLHVALFLASFDRATCSPATWCWTFRMAMGKIHTYIYIYIFIIIYIYVLYDLSLIYHTYLFIFQSSSVYVIVKHSLTNQDFQDHPLGTSGDSKMATLVEGVYVQPTIVVFTICHWLVVWNILNFQYIGNNNPNWRTHIFQRGWNHQTKCVLCLICVKQKGCSQFSNVVSHVFLNAWCSPRLSTRSLS